MTLRGLIATALLAAACSTADGSNAAVTCPTTPDGGRALTNSDVPSGKCNQSAACDFVTEDGQCADPASLPPEFNWHCECVAGQWVCSSTAGHRICLPDGSDGG
jgi:hypothetical protein